MRLSLFLPCVSLRFGWGASSVGRARRSQRRGRGFDPPALHQTSLRSVFGATENPKATLPSGNGAPVVPPGHGVCSPNKVSLHDVFSQNTTWFGDPNSRGRTPDLGDLKAVRPLHGEPTRGRATRGITSVTVARAGELVSRPELAPSVRAGARPGFVPQAFRPEADRLPS